MSCWGLGETWRAVADLCVLGSQFSRREQHAWSWQGLGQGQEIRPGPDPTSPVPKALCGSPWGSRQRFPAHSANPPARCDAGAGRGSGRSGLGVGPGAQEGKLQGAVGEEATLSPSAHPPGRVWRPMGGDSLGESTNGIFHRTRSNNFTICMEIQKTLNSHSNLEKEEWNWRNQAT